MLEQEKEKGGNVTVSASCFNRQGMTPCYGIEIKYGRKRLILYAAICRYDWELAKIINENRLFWNPVDIEMLIKAGSIDLSKVFSHKKMKHRGIELLRQCRIKNPTCIMPDYL